MNYRNCLPGEILKVLAERGPLSSLDLADALAAKAARVHNLLPVMVRDGRIQRIGRRRRFTYALPGVIPGPAEHLPPRVIPAESEADIALVGADKSQRDAIMRQGEYSVAAALARLEAHAARLAEMSAANAKLAEESPPVSPVRSEDDSE